VLCSFGRVKKLTLATRKLHELYISPYPEEYDELVFMDHLDIDAALDMFHNPDDGNIENNNAIYYILHIILI
jgi:hypothetical protein